MSEMLTIAEAAEHYHVSGATIRRWIRSGRVRSQMTLGPYGEQWMVSPDGQVEDPRLTTGYVPVDQLKEDPDRSLIREAEQALKEAWQARQEAESELARVRQSLVPAEAPDLTSLRCDLEGSERLRTQLAAQVKGLEESQNQAWQETRTALRALNQAYLQLEEVQRNLAVLQRESECFRRTLAQRLGLDWQEHSTLELFLRWEVDHEDWASPTLERPGWGQFRRQTVSEDRQTTAG